MANDLYDVDSIQSLSPKEHVQKRPGMYAGDTSNPNQLLLEVFSNSLDEFNIGHGNTIYVDINDDGTCYVADEGQGFPINELRPDGETVLQASFDVVNTSGKFSDDGVYQGTSLGLNGLGSKLVTFLSDFLQVTSYDSKGNAERLRFTDGEFVERELFVDKSHKSGTQVTFKPSEKYFDTAMTSKSFFKNFFEDMTCLCDGLTIRFNGEDISHDSIGDMITRKLGNSIEITSNRLLISNDTYSLAMAYTSSGDSKIVSYVNYGLTSSGPHITSIKSTLTRVLNSWARENNLLGAKDKNLDGSSIQEGLLLVTNLNAKNVVYNAQVKDDISRIDTSFATDFAQQLEVWLDNNPDDAKAILEKAIVARKAAEAARKAREAVKNKAKQTNKAIKMPTTLTDCWSKDRSECELFVAEGKSAASGLVAGRDSKFQAVYGVRGKMLSVLKTKKENIIKNQEINNLVQALGLDYDPSTAKCKYDADRLRYGKIIAAADADSDGAAIENLLFNILWYICPELILNGHVYSAEPPLYRITTKKNEYIFLADDAALEKYKEANPANSYRINRNKGLGEQDSSELSECLLEPDTRVLYQLTVSDMEKTNKMFNDLYGKNVEPRVKFLDEHLEEANID